MKIKNKVAILSLLVISLNKTIAADAPNNKDVSNATAVIPLTEAPATAQPAQKEAPAMPLAETEKEASFFEWLKYKITDITSWIFGKKEEMAPAAPEAPAETSQTDQVPAESEDL